MNGKHSSLLHLPFCIAAITVLMTAIIVAGMFVSSLILNQNYIAIAQQPRQQQEQAPVLKTYLLVSII